MTAHTDYDLARQTLSARFRYECRATGEHPFVREYTFRLRDFFRFELEWMLDACGFQVEALYGNFDGGPFTADSP